MAVTIKTEEELELMRIAGNLLAKVHRQLGKELKEGMTTKDVDLLTRELILSFGGEPNFLGYAGYPAAICVSINDEIVHGIPNEKRYLKNGDVVSLDTGVSYKGYHSDAARTYGIGQISETAQKLIDVTKESFFRGIKNAKPGKYMKDISRGIQDYALGNGFAVVRDLTGHGIGAELHEDPIVPNYTRAFKGPKLLPGMTLAIEPMLNEGNYSVKKLDDGWTFVTADGSLSAHYENTIAITKDGCEIFTMLPEEIEEQRAKEAREQEKELARAAEKEKQDRKEAEKPFEKMSAVDVARKAIEEENHR